MIMRSGDRTVREAIIICAAPRLSSRKRSLGDASKLPSGNGHSPQMNRSTEIRTFRTGVNAA